MKQAQNHPEEYRVLNTAEISINDAVQRKPRSRQVNKIIAEFNPNRVNPVVVSAHEDGTYWCMDGQTTMAVLKSKAGGKDVPVKCRIIYGMTPAEEAEYFYNQDKNVARVQIQDKIRVAYAGGEPNVVNMVDSTTKAGIKIRFSSNNRGDGVCVAVNALWNAYRALGQARYFEMMCTLNETWHGAKDSLRREIIDGMAKLYYVYNGNSLFRSSRFIQKLKCVPPSKIIAEGRAGDTRSAVSYARVMLRYYNSQARKNAKLEDALQ